MEDLTGKKLGPYEIIGPLGEGGMAAVYKAYQAGMDRHVALKVLPQNLAKDPQFLGRFQNEARVIAKLQHPHILPIHDFGEAEGYTYLVMPLISSGTLGGLLKGDPLPLPRVRKLFSQLGDALDYAHTQNLVHRDLKPGNVLVDERGNCLLTDFGIAKLVQGGTEKFTTTGALIGTPAYMSPEQGRGDKVDARTDIYALGVILYEMVTGQVPFSAETPVAVVLKHIQAELPPARSLNPELPEAVEAVLAKALAKDADDRFATAGDMVAALQAAIPEGADTGTWPGKISSTAAMKSPSQPNTTLPANEAKPGTITLTVPPAFARVPVWGWAVAAIIILGLIGGAWNLMRNQQQTAQATQTAEAIALLTRTAPTATPPPAATLAPTALPASPTVPPTLAPTETPALQVGDTAEASTDGALLVFIPAGPFRIGSDDQDPVGQSNEKPSVIVTLKDYWIDQTEVTNLQYLDCVDLGPCTEPNSDHFGDPDYADHPVVGVDWVQAGQYCEWAGRRLPTEAEWEKAARGPEGLIWPWGNQAPDDTRANFTGKATQPVGSYPKGAGRAYGVLDMAGNVWEWTSAWYVADIYKTMPLEDPPSPTTGPNNLRVLRGGSWGTTQVSIRAANRSRNAPTAQEETIGFRCAADNVP